MGQTQRGAAIQRSTQKKSSYINTNKGLFCILGEIGSKIKITLKITLTNVLFLMPKASFKQLITRNFPRKEPVCVCVCLLLSILVYGFLHKSCEAEGTFSVRRLN